MQKYKARQLLQKWKRKSESRDVQFTTRETCGISAFFLYHMIYGPRVSASFHPRALSNLREIVLRGAQSIDRNGRAQTVLSDRPSLSR